MSKQSENVFTIVISDFQHVRHESGRHIVREEPGKLSYSSRLGRVYC